MKTKKFLAVAGLAAASVLILSGCGNGGAADANVKPATSGEVNWWGWTPDTAVAKRYIAEFNKEYPDITVNYKNFENVDYRNTLVPALESGKGPDVYDLSAAGGVPDTWGPYAIDLEPLAKDTLGDDWKKKFSAGYVDQLTGSDGRIVSLPLGGMSAGFLWYNKNIFDEAGATVPTDYTSWVDACAKITAIGKTCFAMAAGGDDTFPTEMYHSIANSVDPEFFIKASTGKAKWNDPAGIEVLEIIAKMKKDGIIASNVLDGTQYPQANEAFMKGSAAMVQMGFWYTQYAEANSCAASMEAAGVANPTCFVQLPLEFPDVAGKGHGSQYFGEVDYGLAIAEDSKNIAASKTFVSWMTMSEKGQQNVANALDLLPGLQGVKPDWNAISLVDKSVQQPAIETLIADSTATTQTRQWQATEKSLHGIVVAIQRVLDPTLSESIPDIAAKLQDASEASTAGTK
ncbi:carbohydrate ABC transporter substrate-binding protein [Mycetocola tolaasinivorans]|uniref:Carbohydrate ABC transporter substrate-binding protein n=1 Tax=Mycetocola tolaasinivorans TaxID=76635 RepID=A0A3L7A8S5_9MICO|nr:ABC transporter substrate-binding protein [Mycetocola tolaasinivorans]RLP76806.1 carbohydrate ABC transporter substrate-binding protein [Mycetocola tolaasinivorans]